MSVKRLIAIGAFVSLCACASPPEVAEPEAVPLPRSRPKALASPPPGELKPRREEFVDFQEKMERNSALARRWTLCKLLHADGLARNTFFFFQAEDGIRVDLVTGVQTCALPIS